MERPLTVVYRQVPGTRAVPLRSTVRVPALTPRFLAVPRRVIRRKTRIPASTVRQLRVVVVEICPPPSVAR